MRMILAGYALLMGVLAVAQLVFPAIEDFAYGAIGITGAIAIAIGCWRNRPRKVLPWLAISGALLAFVTGDVTYRVLTNVFGLEAPFPSAADALYLLVSTPLSAVGLFSLARSGAAQRDRASVLDALILTSGFGLLTWIFVINPYVQTPDLTPFEKMISIAYPMYDVLILATVARLLIGVRLTPSTLLLALGGLSLTIGDIVYSFMALNNTWVDGTPLDLLWNFYYIAWGAAALHPSMTRLTEPRVLRRSEMKTRRVVILALSSLVAPAVLIVESLSGEVKHGEVIAVASTVMFLIVITRLAGVVQVHRQAVLRERALRHAGAVMTAATEAAEVEAAVRSTVAQLLPAGAPHGVVLTTAAVDNPVEEGAGPSTRTVDMIYTRTLEEPLAAELGDFEVTLRCSLSLSNRLSGEAGVGTLLVAAAERALVELQDSLEVLASQAALALERISLSDEIHRRRSEEYFRTLVHNMADVILILDDENKIKYASPSAAGVFGDRRLAGTPLLDQVHPDDRALARQILRLARRGERIDGGGDWWVLRTDGGSVQVEVSCRDLRSEATVTGLVLTLRDVTEQRRLEHELTHQALHDSLTGLANRALLRERVQHAVARSRRTNNVIGVLFVDLDDFKVVNETMGHEVGDELLVSVAERLAAAVRSHDTVARLGGDEFAVLIEDVADPLAVEQVAQHIMSSLAAPLSLRGTPVNAGASIGVATTEDALDSQDLLRQADLALYAAKGAGKGRWLRYQSALHSAILERLEIRTELDRAVADEAFVLQYQPIMDLSAAQAVGFEALVRWNHPTRGLVAPGQFIEVAEESGLIVPIGNWVLRNAIATAAGWYRRSGAAAPYVSVNVSARQFRSAGFLDLVRAELEAAGLPPAHLVLEITESLLLRDDDQVFEDLGAIRETGTRIAIDDFGTGYSSLSYLRQMPVDILKIDRSFIGTVASSEQQRALVEGIVRLAHTLKLAVVAEGIEQAADRDALIGMGCQYGQGYLFAKPLPEADVEAWLLGDPVAA